MSSSTALIVEYLAGLELLRSSVAGLGLDHLTARPVAGKWSTFEVVCHLVDSEQAWCHRMKRVIAEPSPLLIGYDESAFAQSLACHCRDIEEELALLEGMRRQMARILRSLPDSAWGRKGVHSERGLMTLEELLRAEAEHVPHHVGYILEKRRALGVPVEASLAAESPKRSVRAGQVLGGP
jgi:uncharacterized damage-inducible protein DinB